ncbi:MAG: universal stress protein [Leptospirales bacterium]|nr:universal stress protein [Leptospirales bacterium]
MICSKILIAYDESEIASRALEKTAEIAKTDAAIEVDIIHIIDVPIISGIDQFVAKSIADNFNNHGKEVLAKAMDYMKSFPNRCETFLVEGKAAPNIILNHCKEHNCDLIIMGSRGLSGIKELLGSVSHTVIQQSTVPVLIVK